MNIEDKLRKLKQGDKREYINAVFEYSLSAQDKEPVPPQLDPLLKGMRMKENQWYDPDPLTAEQALLEGIKQAIKLALDKRKERETKEEALAKHQPDILDIATDAVLLTTKGGVK